MDSSVSLTAHPQVLRTCVRVNVATNAKPHPLGSVNDLRIQQGLIVQDILFALLGFQGSYIRFSERYNAQSADSRLKGPDFKIAKHLDISLKSIAKKVVRYGKSYCSLVAFVEVYDFDDYGQVVQSLCSCIRQFLGRYRAVVADIESQFKHNVSFSLNLVENSLTSIANDLYHLYELVNEVHADTTHRQVYKTQEGEEYLSNFIQSIENDLLQTGSINLSTDNNKLPVCKGGLVLQIVQKRINSYKGDMVALRFLSQLFDTISKSYVAMLNSWLMNGDIDDVFGEFFIKQNKSIGGLLDESMEKYWDELYVTRTDGLIEQFLNKSIQLKVLTTGKLLNIFKACSGIDDFSSPGDVLTPIESLYSQDFELKINNYYKRANKLFLKFIFEGYHFTSSIEYLQNIYLFKDSFNIDLFLSRSIGDLKRNKYSIPTSRLLKNYNEIFHKDSTVFKILLTEEEQDETTSLFQSESFSIDSTNFYDLAKEIINVKSFDTEEALKSKTFKNLLNKSLLRSQMASSSDLGEDESKKYDPDHSDEYSIAAVNLDLNVPFPLNIVLPENYIFEYQLIFKLQMILKFISKLIDLTWREINYSKVWAYGKFDPSMKKWILRCRILHSRMRDFINELQFYVNEETIEQNYESLKKYLSEFHNSLSRQPLTTIMEVNQAPRINFTSSQNNSIFDEKINAANFRLRDNREASNEAEMFEGDVNALTNRLGSFLNSILKDCLVTNHVMIESMKNLFDIIILYNNNLSRLKKSLILVNAELFESYNREYPEKFVNKQVDPETISIRFNNLNNMLNTNYEIFNNSLTNFIVNLRDFAELESHLVTKLLERLETCFPDK